MQELFYSLLNYKRYCEKGKIGFRKEVINWVRQNADNFNIRIEKTKFFINFKEFIKTFVLLINSILLIYCFQYFNFNIYILDLLIFLLIFPIQFRLIFLLLSIIFPSNNIILSKRAKYSVKDKVNIIITAHYDTKNCILKSKNIYKELFKKHFYSIIRIFGNYINWCQKLFIPILALGNLFFLIEHNINAVPVSIAYNSPKYLLGFVFYLSSSVFFTSLICTVIMVISCQSILKRPNNPAADDNTSGVVGALQIAKELNNIELENDINIILFDNEEKGLIGSSHFVSKNHRLLKYNNSQIVNLDCIGRGENIYLLSQNTKKNYIYQMLINKMKSMNIEYNLTNIDFSDHKPFLTAGISALSIGRYNAINYLGNKSFPSIYWIHGSEDDTVDMKKIKQIVDILVGLIKSA